jgi:hypothetical protein
MWVWLGLLAYLGVVELFITVVGAGLEQDPRSVLFSWPSLAVFGSAGLVGVWLSIAPDSRAPGTNTADASGWCIPPRWGWASVCWPSRSAD